MISRDEARKAYFFRQGVQDAEPCFLSEIATLETILSLYERVDELEHERDLAIAHDRQPYPTAHAYEQAIKALSKCHEALAVKTPKVYTCAQCGPDPRGGELHAWYRHTFAGMEGEPYPDA